MYTVELLNLKILSIYNTCISPFNYFKVINSLTGLNGKEWYIHVGGTDRRKINVLLM